MKTVAQIRCSSSRGRSGGFTLIELLIAMTILTVGLLGSMGIIFVATANNGRSKLNTTAATLAESTMEKIVAIPQSATGPAAMTQVNDCAGNAFVVDTNPGGSPLIAPGAFDAAVDYTQAPVPNYSMQYGGCPAGSGVRYDVRWRIDPGPTPGTQLVTVSAKAMVGNASPAAVFARPVTLHNYRGNL
ncbi:MAG: prepilin-type N-terminal cleavage/methylation domain-containing protein [Acidobacteriia bacterium]|nr:prepilin-type N-terminal cleavage/methylation domain-containing protein [Terriglobia bacterium]